MKPTAVLLLACPDAKGLVAAVSSFIYAAGGNIIHADQHSDAEQGIFLQRIEWELDGFKIPRENIADAFRPIAQRFAMDFRLCFSDTVPRVAILVSRQAHCLHDLLARRQMGELGAELPLVVSNHEDLRPVVEAVGVAFHALPVGPGDESAASDAILRLCQAEGIDLIVLARYMRLLRGDILVRYRSRIINIHHSFLPAFAGARPYHQAHEHGVKIIGATAHYVTEKLDEGPIIEQDVARVRHADSVGELIRKGRDLEKVVLARAVELHLRHRVIVYGRKTAVFN